MSNFKKARTEYRFISNLYLLFWGDDPEALYCASGPEGQQKIDALAQQLNFAYQTAFPTVEHSELYDTGFATPENNK